LQFGFLTAVAKPRLLTFPNHSATDSFTSYVEQSITHNDED